MAEEKKDSSLYDDNDENGDKGNTCWDYCLVFPKRDEHDKNTQDILKSIQRSGLEIYCFKSAQKDEIICKIRAPLEKLQEYADATDRRFLCSEFILRDYIEQGNDKLGIKPLKINQDKEYSKISPYKFIYARYDTDKKYEDLYRYVEDMPHPFSSIIRIQLIHEILSSRMQVGGAGLKLRTMVQDGDLLAAFPLHNHAQIQSLAEEWLVWFRIKLPLEKVKDYFGEKIALYHSFLGHYTVWCGFAAIAGIITQITLWGVGDPEHFVGAIFAMFIAVWGIFMLEAWKRKESNFAMQWGTAGIEDSLPDRPEFFGQTTASPITGEQIVHFPANKRLMRQMASLGIIFSSILIVLFAVGGIYTYRYYLVNVKHNQYGATIASFLNSAQILILNEVYSSLAIFLTNHENHRTDVAFEDNLIGKLFVFQFINTFSSFFYIAFAVKLLGHEEEECGGNCMDSLAKNIAIIFMTSLVFQNFNESMVPFVKYRLNLFKETFGAKKKVLGQAEKEYSRVEYDHVMGVLDDYAELAVQFGFLTMFVVAYPTTPLLAFFNNWVEQRTDAYKLLYLHQRPVPTRVQDIGTWQSVFTLIAGISVMTNAAIVTFVMGGVFGGHSNQTKIWGFAIILYIVFGLQSFIGFVIPDVTEEVTMQLQRQDFLSNLVMNQAISSEERRTTFRRDSFLKDRLDDHREEELSEVGSAMTEQSAVTNV
mmetsp:Transcript_7686/g.10234  ORF Transcript_7686/g.10234 Transcript_7686/m.10234 type:complete len:705 (-) Transcript_7686:312-2426(-)|eukprot:CAMPEP_0117746828 /NCGR_PEP_ID=MMETSP0947-20121206/8165_1 /TAXON_ID=44440 /ORGANISM="Chattonella subsalsa, Strain CCMP2191" /LENGTH=704 /DNA_ID=CAMNT_0005564199 /DNA_START=75 /DNA_END=2189 /DNA_ORIENTATION=-